MAFNVAEFRSQMIGDGARPNLFAVTLTFPLLVDNGTVSGQKVTFMAKAAQLPGSTVGTVPVYYFGRELKFPGNRTFPDWTITIINDEDFLENPVRFDFKQFQKQYPDSVKIALGYKNSLLNTDEAAKDYCEKNNIQLSDSEKYRFGIR